MLFTLTLVVGANGKRVGITPILRVERLKMLRLEITTQKVAVRRDTAMLSVSTFQQIDLIQSMAHHLQFNLIQQESDL